jgi:hypothetical protein
MSSTEIDREELKNLLQSTADDLISDYYGRCSDFLARLGLHSELDGGESIPLEIWVGLAQALADVSGYRVNLQAQVIEPVKDDPKRFKLAGLREMAAAPPHRFLKATESCADLGAGLKNARLIKVYC